MTETYNALSLNILFRNVIVAAIIRFRHRFLTYFENDKYQFFKKCHHYIINDRKAKGFSIYENLLYVQREYGILASDYYFERYDIDVFVACDYYFQDNNHPDFYEEFLRDHEIPERFWEDMKRMYQKAYSEHQTADTELVATAGLRYTPNKKLPHSIMEFVQKEVFESVNFTRIGDTPVDVFAMFICNFIEMPTYKGKFTTIYLFISHYISKLSTWHQEDILEKILSNCLGFIVDYTPSGELILRTATPNEYMSDFEATSGIKDKAAQYLNLFDKILEFPNKYLNSINGLHIRKLFTFVCFHYMIPDDLFNMAKFIKLYDTKFAEEFHDINIETVTSLLRSITGLTRSALGITGKFAGSLDPLDYVREVDYLESVRHSLLTPASKERYEESITLVEWNQRVQSCWDKKHLIYNAVGHNTRLLLNQAYRKLESLYDQCRSYTPDARSKPFVVGLRGDSQCGKTTFIAPTFSQIILNELGITVDHIHEGFQILNGNDPYLAGYDPNRDHSVLFDEMGAYSCSEKDSKNVINSSFLEMTSSGRMMLNRASLEEKGKVEFRPSAIFIASNSEDFGISRIVNTPEAAWNRFDMILTVKIKSEFRAVNEKGEYCGGIDRHALENHQNKLVAEHGEKALAMDDYYPVYFMGTRKAENGFENVDDPLGFIQVCKMVKEEAKIHAQRISKDQVLSKTNILKTMEKLSTEDSEIESLDLDSDKDNEDETPEFVAATAAFIPGLGADLPSPKFFETVCAFLLYIWYCILYYGAIYTPFVTRTMTEKIAHVRFYAEVELELMNALKRIQKNRMAVNETITRYAKIYLAKTEVYNRINNVAISVAAIAIIYKFYNIYKNKNSQVYHNTGKLEARDSLPPNNLLGRIPSKFHGVNNIYGVSDKQILYPKASSAPAVVLKEHIMRNLYVLELHIPDTQASSTCHLLNIHDCYYLAPWHLVRYFDKDYTFTIHGYVNHLDEKGPCSSPYRIMTLSCNACKYVKISNDIAVLSIRQNAPGPSLKKYLMQDFGSITYFDGVNIHVNNGECHEDKFRGSYQKVQYSQDIFNKEAPVTIEAIVGQATTNSYVGRCGSPLYCYFGKQLCLVGINIVGKPGTPVSGFDFLTVNDLDEAITKLNHGTSMLSPTSSVLIQDSFVIGEFADNFVLPTRNNHTFWLEVEEIQNIKLLATMSNINVARPKSKVFELKTHKAFFNYFPPEYHHDLVKPNFRSYVEDGTYFGVYRNMLNQVSVQAHDINDNHVNMIVKHLIEKFGAVEEFKNLEFWDMDHATSGASHNSYCKAIPKTTGAGFPFNKKKIYFLEPSSSEYAPEGMVPNAYVKDRILKLLDLMKTGTRPMFLYKTCMKDEPRAKEKVKTRSIRVFTCAPMDAVIIQKMYFGSFAGIFCNNYLETETVNGLNCYSKDWGAVFNKLKKHPNCINGDYSKYDKKASSAMICAAFSVMTGVIEKHLDISEDCKNIFRVMMSEICHPVLLLEKEIIGLNGSLSSGIYLTLLLNNIMNSIYIRLAWLDIFEDKLDNPLQEFEENVVFFAMGDDNTFTVSDKYISQFNFKSIQNYFHRIGIKYTNADKSDKVYGHVDVSEATICKRRFVPIGDHVFCPIEKPTIGKMLTMALREGPLTEDQKILASCSSAVYDFFQYGEDEYNLNISRLTKVLKESDIIIPPFPSYVEMYQRIVGNSETPWTDNLFDKQEDVSGFQATTSVGLTDFKQRLILPPFTKNVESGDTISPYYQVSNYFIPKTSYSFDEASFNGNNLIALFKRYTTMDINTNEPNAVSSEPTIQKHDESSNIEIREEDSKVEENVHYVTGKSTYDVSVDNTPSLFDVGVTPTVTLGNSLKRPVKIAEFNWTVNTQITGLIDPWVLWQSNAFVKSKLQNFTYFRCNLKIRIVPSATPFLYGQLMLNYVPYGTQNEMFNETYNTLRTSGAGGARVAYQQYMSTYPITGFLNASEQNVVEMTLPFIYNGNFLPIAGASGTGKFSLGSINYSDLNVLSRANDTASTVMNVAVFCWAEDFEMHVPTNLVPTAGKGKALKKYRITNETVNDETEEAVGGVLSNTATAIANVSGRLTDIPVIGPFARATTIGANAVGGIARIFGFSNPVTIETSQPRVLRLFRNLATTDQPDTATKLSLDSKQELTIDPRVIGAGSNDDMAFKSMYTREQWLTKGKWLGAGGQFVTAGAEKIVLAAIVNPFAIRRTDTWGTTPTRRATVMSPAGYVARLFKYWRGSITYRIEVVASKYHSGALQIQFDPMVQSAALAVSDVYTAEVNTRQTIIMDISECKELEITIDYVNNNVMLKCRGIASSTFTPRKYDDTAFDLQTAKNADTDLGMLVVSVLNELVAPGDVSQNPGTGAGVDVNLYMKCEELTLGQPDEGWEDSIFVPTSGIGTFNKKVLIEAQEPGDVATVMGETCVSARMLLKRPMATYVNNFVQGSGTDGQLVTANFPHFAPETLRGASRRLCYESYFSPAFFAKRGGMRWKFFLWNDQTINTARDVRSYGLLTVARKSTEVPVSAIASVIALNNPTHGTIVQDFQSGATGMSITKMSYNNTVDIELPFYSNTRFALACAITNVTAAGDLTKNPTMNQILYQQLKVQGKAAAGTLYYAFTSTAEDYNLIMFQAPPVVYEFT